MAKVITKHRIVSEGKASSRVALDYDSGLIYSYHEPENITAVYELGQWHLTERPNYSSGGGWGQQSSGDKEGYETHSNTVSLLKSIEAKARVYNIPHFYTTEEYQEYLKAHKKVQELNRLAERLDVRQNYQVEFKELKSESIYYSTHGREDKPKGKGKGIDPILAVLKMEEACKVFTERKGKAIDIAGYKITKDKVSQGETTVAFYDSKGDVFMNSQVLKLSPFEHSFLGGQSMIQNVVKKVAKHAIPFNVLDSANLKLNETTILEKGPESNHTVDGSERHFTGALLLDNAGRKFLMDLDQIEAKNGLFNVFFVEVHKDSDSIESAYESMKPESVKLAETNGLEVKRQGEWFFIKTSHSIEVPQNEIYIWNESKAAEKRVERFDIAHGKGRPNQLFKPIGFGFDDLVCGVVSHTGREHKDLSLGVYDSKGDDIIDMPRIHYRHSDDSTPIPIYKFQLWKVVPNATIGNFTITGDVD